MVSVVITTRNRLTLLKRAIASVLGQSYCDVECIVVSDGSTDGTDEYCRSLEGIEFIAISEAESKGGNHARNCGIMKAKGEYVAFLDDDDYWLPEKIEKFVEVAHEMKCGFVYSGRIEELGDYYKYPTTATLPTGDVSRAVLQNIFASTSTIMVRRDLLIAVGMFDENLKFWQEYELMIRLAQETEFYHTEEPLTVYRIDKNDEARLTNKYIGWTEAVAYIRKKHDKLYRRLSPIEYARYRLMVWQDARMRCRTSGLRCRYCMYTIMVKLSKILGRVVRQTPTLR